MHLFLAMLAAPLTSHRQLMSQAQCDAAYSSITAAATTDSACKQTAGMMPSLAGQILPDADMSVFSTVNTCDELKSAWDTLCFGGGGGGGGGGGDDDDDDDAATIDIGDTSGSLLLTSSPAAQSLCDGALGVYLGVTLGGALLFGLLLFGAAMLTKDKPGGTPKRRKRSSVLAVKPSKDGFEFIVILAASVALGVATLIGRPVPIYYCNAYGSYAGATAPGSLLMVIAVLVVKWRALRPALGAQVAPGITVQGALGIWFTVWWATAAGVITYIAPIEVNRNPSTGESSWPCTGAGCWMLPFNAYFSLWVGFVASAYMLSRATRPLDNAGVFTDDNRMPLIGLFFSGLVLMLASIPYVETTNVGIYLLTCGATTIIVTLALLVFGLVFARHPRSRLLLKIAAFVLWVTVVYYATFAETAPFKSVSADAIGNGCAHAAQSSAIRRSSGTIRRGSGAITLTPPHPPPSSATSRRGSA